MGVQGQSGCEVAPRKKAAEPKVRMSMDAHEEVRELIIDLRDRTHADSMYEVVRRAVKVYDLLERESEGGLAVVTVRQKGQKDRELMIFL